MQFMFVSGIFLLVKLCFSSVVSVVSLASVVILDSVVDLV